MMNNSVEFFACILLIRYKRSRLACSKFEFKNHLLPDFLLENFLKGLNKMFLSWLLGIW